MFFLLDENEDNNVSLSEQDNIDGLTWTYYDRRDNFQGRDRGIWFGKKLIIFNSGMFKDNKVPESVMKVCEYYTNIPDQVIHGYFGDGGKSIYLLRRYNPFIVALIEAFFVYACIDYGANVTDVTATKKYLLADPLRMVSLLDAANALFPGFSVAKHLKKIGHANVVKAFKYIEEELFPRLAKVQHINGMIGNPYASYIEMRKTFGQAKKDMEKMWSKERNGIDRISYFYVAYLFRLERNPFITPVLINDPTIIINMGILLGLMTSDYAKNDIMKDLPFIPDKEISFSMRAPITEEANLIHSNDAILVNEEENIQIIL